ncbi:MAG: hypothetical protein Q8L64_00230 [bacterium]|nr:hypothetical protein [bacterium]
MNNNDSDKNTSFAIEVSGSLTDNIPVPQSLISTLVQAIAQISSEPIQKVVIRLIEYRAEIRIINDRADTIVKIAKFRNIAEVYNKAILEADKARFFSDEMKQEYLETLRQDYIRQWHRSFSSELPGDPTTDAPPPRK